MEHNLQSAKADTRTLHRQGPLRRFYKEHSFGYFLLAPAVIYLLAFQFYPLFETVRLSFFNYSLVRKTYSFAGFGNYVYLMTEDKNFWLIVKNSLLWVFGSTLLQIAIAIPAALILNNAIRMRGLWRGLVMVPWVSPVVIIGIIWKWLLDGHFGLVNYYLQQLGIIKEGIVWLGDEFWVWPSLLLSSAWKGFPYVTLMFLAGLTGISKEMLEAASIDGANAWQRFGKIVLPLLKPIIFVTGMTQIISTWTKFEMIWALTNGGPGFTTSILPTYLYTNAFVFFDLGRGSAIATLSMVLVLILVVLYTRLFRGGQDA
ncbi:carbohydrate ABC transporter permease [Paenibacillus thalictri]|nr:sugar ABC transporter permease [Paenibacillus thalictri]